VLAAIIAAVGLPMILAYVLVAADMRTELSELKPRASGGGAAATLIGWPDLEARNGSPLSFEDARWNSQPRVRMLGYMMDGYTASRDGDQVEMFILLPDAGQFLHPAHRVPKQMVEIWLSNSVPFTFRRLVWTSGILARTPGRRDSDKALYVMKDASVEPATESDITRWFTP
jgi:hypothetical protein